MIVRVGDSFFKYCVFPALCFLPPARIDLKKKTNEKHRKNTLRPDGKKNGGKKPLENISVDRFSLSAAGVRQALNVVGQMFSRATPHLCQAAACWGLLDWLMWLASIQASKAELDTDDPWRVSHSPAIAISCIRSILATTRCAGNASATRWEGRSAHAQYMYMYTAKAFSAIHALCIQPYTVHLPSTYSWRRLQKDPYPSTTVESIRSPTQCLRREDTECPTQTQDRASRTTNVDATLREDLTRTLLARARVKVAPRYDGWENGGVRRRLRVLGGRGGCWSSAWDGTRRWDGDSGERRCGEGDQEEKKKVSFGNRFREGDLGGGGGGGGWDTAAGMCVDVCLFDHVH